MIFTYESKSTKPIANNNFFIEFGVNWKQTSLNLNEGWLICLLLSVRIYCTEHGRILVEKLHCFQLHLALRLFSK